MLPNVDSETPSVIEASVALLAIDLRSVRHEKTHHEGNMMRLMMASG